MTQLDEARAMAEAMGFTYEPIGLVGGRPVYPVMGGAVDGPPDEDKPEDDVPDEDEDKPDDEDEDDDEQDPAKLRAERKALREALKEKNSDVARNRKLRLAAEEKLRQGAPNPDEATKAIEEARTAAREPLIRKLLTASARSAFLTAGFQGEVSERFIKLIDRDALDIDDDGEIDGLDEQIAQIKRDFPEKFKRKRTGPGDTGKADREERPKAMSASERQAASLQRK